MRRFIYQFYNFLLWQDPVGSGRHVHGEIKVKALNIVIHYLNNQKSLSLSPSNYLCEDKWCIGILQRIDSDGLLGKNSIFDHYIHFNIRITVYISGKETSSRPIFANSTWIKIMKFWTHACMCIRVICKCSQLNFLKQVVPLNTIQKTLGYLLLAQTASQRSMNILMILYDISRIVLSL